ncbi:MAG: NAD(P)/FAD-dependent oxidoreductase [Candidatus Uhrbacteria bacterium]|nr:NAD(P)/FAD-dependent oxidoreductase [Candidatus Uhrbacteria bacterium]
MSKSGKRIVILGGGFGGLVTALRLGDKLKGHEIVIVDNNLVHVYTPWLYDVSTGFLLDSNTHKVSGLKKTSGIEISKVIKNKGLQDKIRLKKAMVMGLDLEGSHVLLTDGKNISYDILAIALGAETEYYNIDGLEEHSITLKSLDDALLIREKLDLLLEDLRNGKRQRVEVIIGGAGATGTECAAELANFLARCVKSGIKECERIGIRLLDAAPTILGSFSKSAQKKARARLEELGVEIITDTIIQKACKNKITVAPRSASTDQLSPNESPFKKETELQNDILIWSGGICVNKVVRLFELPKDKRGRIKVSRTLQVDGHPNIFALGDVASLIDPETEKPVPQLGQVAVAEAKLLAKNIKHKILDQDLEEFSIPSYWPSIVPVGGKFAIANFKRITFSGYFAYLLRRVADFKYFATILALREAYNAWRSGIKVLGKND